MNQLGMLWADMGFIRWPLFFSMIAIVAIASWSAWSVYRSGATADLRTKTWIDAILFWGGWLRPFPSVSALAFLDIIPPILWFAIKVVVFIYFYLWFRASWPRCAC